MPNDWVKALKMYNHGKPTFQIPRKGTKEYKAVKSLKFWNDPDNVKRVQDSQERKSKK